MHNHDNASLHEPIQRKYQHVPGHVHPRPTLTRESAMALDARSDGRSPTAVQGIIEKMRRDIAQAKVDGDQQTEVRLTADLVTIECTADEMPALELR